MNRVVLYVYQLHSQMLVSGTVHELSETVILQMIGRAGRPQFDDHGVAVIMTQNSNVVSVFLILFYFLLLHKHYTFA